MQKQVPRRGGALDTSFPPPLLDSKCPFIVSGGAREPSLSVLQIYSEGRISSFSCAFAGWTG